MNAIENATAVVAEMLELTADAILAAQDIAIEPVDVPEWGGRVYVRGLSGTAKERYLDSLRVVEGRGRKQNIKVNLVEAGAKLLVDTLCDKHGTLLFTRFQIEALGKKSSKALQRCIDAASKLNGLADDSEEEAGNGSGSTTDDASATS